MTNFFKNLPYLLVLLLLNCNTSDVEIVYENIVKDSTVYANPERPGTLFSKLIDTNITKHVRLVEMKFKVKKVDEVCENIEDILLMQNGYLSKKYLKTIVSKITKRSISNDSCLLTTYYSTTNTILLRVPNEQLESTLKDIRKKIEFLDYKFILTDDKLEEQLVDQKQIESNQDFNKKINIAASNSLAEKKELYSAIIVTFYENPTFKTEFVAKEKPMKVYDPNFNTQLCQSFNSSLDYIKNCILAIVKYWTFIILLILLIGVVYYLHLKSRKYDKN
jgi:hypothetical protein